MLVSVLQNCVHFSFNNCNLSITFNKTHVFLFTVSRDAFPFIFIQVTSWSNHMLPCAPNTLYLALAWIRSINCSPGSDLWGALSAALVDPACEAINLICTSWPRWSQALPTEFSRLAVGRPLNIFCLHSSTIQLDEDKLQHLALATGGRCYNILVSFSVS